jgi:hypothetical protein
MTKASCTKKTFQNKGFRHWTESQPIEGMNPKMPGFQPLSVTMATQRKQTKEIRNLKSKLNKEFRQ